MKQLVGSPIFGVLSSIIAYEIGFYINRKTKLSIFNPLLIAMVVLITFLTKFHITYDKYNNGGQLISFFLGPATIALALPTYKKISLFKENALPVLAGILCGAICGMICVIILSKTFGLPYVLIKSLIPKSITTPIGIAVSKQIGGLPSVTVVAIILTGIIGSIIGPLLNKLLKLNDKVAMGIAMGASCHAIGTAKAIEIGETEGAMSGLTMAISGIITVFLAPLLMQLFM